MPPNCAPALSQLRRGRHRPLQRGGGRAGRGAQRAQCAGSGVPHQHSTTGGALFVGAESPRGGDAGRLSVGVAYGGWNRSERWLGVSLYIAIYSVTFAAPEGREIFFNIARYLPYIYPRARHITISHRTRVKISENNERNLGATCTKLCPRVTCHTTATVAAAASRRRITGLWVRRRRRCVSLCEQRDRYIAIYSVTYATAREARGEKFSRYSRDICHRRP